jgi:guanylate kinase
MMPATASLFIISAPSGAGKSSLIKALLAADKQVVLSTSHTTRAPRGQEQHGREYFFANHAEFDRLIADNALLEWAAVHGQRYGTTRETVLAQLAQGQDVILEIDYQGAFQVQQQLPQAQLIFILPPSMAALRARIEGRGEDAPEKIALRMDNAKTEMTQAGKFDFVIINDSFESALADLKSILAAQRLRPDAQRQRHAALFAALQIA